MNDTCDLITKFNDYDLPEKNRIPSWEENHQPFAA